MLLPSMTYKEMYDNLAADLEKVKIKEEYLLPRAVKEFRKERKGDFLLGDVLNIQFHPRVISTLYSSMQIADFLLKSQRQIIFV